MHLFKFAQGTYLAIIFPGFWLTIFILTAPCLRSDHLNERIRRGQAPWRFTGQGGRFLMIGLSAVCAASQWPFTVVVFKQVWTKPLESANAPDLTP